MTFTTEERRRMTSASGLADETKEEMLNQFNLAYSNEVDKDATNNEMFRLKNSELTGLAFEYRYLTGEDHPTLDEIEIPYVGSEDGKYINKTYWDSPRLQAGANLETGNEFHLNLREDTSVKFPVHPDKYGSWDDIYKYNIDFDLTEANIMSAIDTTLTAMLVLSYTPINTIPENVEIFGEYKEYTNGYDIEDQSFMTIYKNLYPGDTTYMDTPFDRDGDWVFINKTGTDPETGLCDNFAFGKIVASNDLPSRVLFAPYAVKGTIPDNSSITTYVDPNVSTDLDIIQAVIIQSVATLRKYFNMMVHYLEYNPTTNTSNTEALTTAQLVITAIDAWDSDPETADTLMTAINAIRTSTVRSNRISAIDTYLISAPAITLYDERFTVIDYRLSKKMGTLKQLMTVQKGSDVVIEVIEDNEAAATWNQDQFFLVKKALKDGDFQMRLHVNNVDEINDLEIDDECYILTDDKTVPELHGKVYSITNSRVRDLANTTYDINGNVVFAYKSCKKIFFKTIPTASGRSNWLTFTDKYKIVDNLRIIKELT